MAIPDVRKAPRQYTYRQISLRKGGLTVIEVKPSGDLPAVGEPNQDEDSGYDNWGDAGSQESLI